MQSVAVNTSTHVTSPAKRRSAPLDPQTADRLLDLLSTDDPFRRLFKRDPRKALDQVGFVESAMMVSPAWCFSGITKLASKHDIIEARAVLKEMLTSGLALQPVQLNVGTASRRRRI